MTTDEMHLAVWRDCSDCNGTGRGLTDRVCWLCHGLGKRPTFIPLDEIVIALDNYSPNNKSAPSTILAILEWLKCHDAAVDELTAELDASGLVPDVPAPEQPSLPDQAQIELPIDPEDNVIEIGEFSSAPEFALPKTAPSHRELGSHTLPPDAGKDLDLKPSATSADIGTPPPDLPEGAWPEHPAKTQESLELAMEQIVANSCPSENMGKIDRQGNAVDDRDERLQIIFSTALDVLARLRGIGQEGIALPEHPAKLIPAQVKPVPDLPTAARHLLDVLKRHHFVGTIKAGKTQLQDAARAVWAVWDALDGSPAQVSPDVSQAQYKARLAMLHTVMWAIRTELDRSTPDVAMKCLQAWLEDRKDCYGAKIQEGQPEGQKTCLTCAGGGHLPSTGMSADRLPGGWFVCNDCKGTGVQPDQKDGSQ